MLMLRHLAFFFSLQRNVIFNRSLSKKLRTFFFSKNFEKGTTSLRNRCIINNRSRAVYSKFNISRIL